MTHKLDNLSSEEFEAAKNVVTDMRRKEQDEIERQRILNGLGSLWPEGEPVIYIAQQNSDLTEGRGPIVDRGYFLDKTLAHIVNDSLMGVQGYKNDARVRVERIYLTLAEWKAARGK